MVSMCVVDISGGVWIKSSNRNIFLFFLSAEQNFANKIFWGKLKKEFVVLLLYINF